MTNPNGEPMGKPEETAPSTPNLDSQSGEPAGDAMQQSVAARRAELKEQARQIWAKRQLQKMRQEDEPATQSTSQSSVEEA